jgi:hypothetical protein
MGKYRLRPMWTNTNSFFRMVTNVRKAGGGQDWRPLHSSRKDQCTRLSVEQLKSKLSTAKNLFSDSPWLKTGQRGICLPPSSVLTVSSDEITITNPFSKLSLKFVLLPASFKERQKGGFAVRSDYEWGSPEVFTDSRIGTTYRAWMHPSPRWGSSEARTQSSVRWYPSAPWASHCLC